MVVCFNGGKFLSHQGLSHTDDKYFIIFLLQFTAVQQFNSALGLYKASMFNFSV